MKHNVRLILAMVALFLAGMGTSYLFYTSGHMLLSRITGFLIGFTSATILSAYLAKKGNKTFR